MKRSRGGILLIVPPFQSITRPALGVSQLKAILQEAGFPTQILYLNLSYAEHIGPDVYEWISNGTTTILFGEFIFSYLLFERQESDIVRYVEEVLADSDTGGHFDRFKSKPDRLRDFIHKASDLINGALEEIIPKDPWLVGMTSAFQQNCASILLTKVIKQRRPEIITVMGGANCQSVMGEELFARFPDIDYIGQGECDHSFLTLVRSLFNGGSSDQITGFLSRDKNQRHTPSGPLHSDDLNRLPYPVFGDYFTQLSKVNFKDRIMPGLIMETSRGCWWGAKHKCTFCGLNGEEVAFRSKSPSRALEEMAGLTKKYAVPRIELTDNVLAMQYFKTVLPELAKDRIADLFYEVRPNLSKEQVQLLSRSNIKVIQPGIESFSDASLKLMHKGTTALQNIQLMKWCTEAGISVAWNYLFGFPGENEEEISEITSIIKAVHHLLYPHSVHIIHLDRFSPYFIAPELHGLGPVYPAGPYRHVYPFSDKSLRRIAYFYQSDFLKKKSKSEAFKALRESVSSWQKLYYRSHLLAIPWKNSLVIIDTRISRHRFCHILTKVPYRVYEYCDKARSLSEILDALGPEVSHDEAASILQSLVSSRLMLEVNGRYLSLATYWGNSYRNFTKIFPGGTLIGSKGPKVQKKQKEQADFRRVYWKFRKYFLDVMGFRIRPWDRVIALTRNCVEASKKTFTTLVLKTIFFLANLLSKQRRNQAERKK
jgi:ribosomal peptide maturation radical SAM protein 1